MDESDVERRPGLLGEAAATHEILYVRLHVGVVHEHAGVVHAEGGERGRDVELDAIDLAVADVGRGEHPAVGRLRGHGFLDGGVLAVVRSEEHTSELQSLMRISYAVFCLKKKK